MGGGGAALLLEVGGEGAGLGEGGDFFPPEVGGAGAGLAFVAGGDGAGFGGLLTTGILWLEGTLGMGLGGYDLEGGGTVVGGVSVAGAVGVGDSVPSTLLLVPFKAGEWCGLRGTGFGLGFGVITGFPSSAGISL